MQPIRFVKSGQGLNGCGLSPSERGGLHQGDGRHVPTSASLTDIGGRAEVSPLRHWGHHLSS
ncbi:MAG: hypothetical protein AAYR33_07270 [Acetobacteraceae bacterium]